VPTISFFFVIGLYSQRDVAAKLLKRQSLPLYCVSFMPVTKEKLYNNTFPQLLLLIDRKLPQHKR